MGCSFFSKGITIEALKRVGISALAGVGSGLLSIAASLKLVKFGLLSAGGCTALWCGSAAGEIHVAKHLPSGVNRNYWSATTKSNNTSNAWYTNLSNGNTNNNGKSNSKYVRCVRSGMESFTCSRA